MSNESENKDMNKERTFDDPRGLSFDEVMYAGKYVTLVGLVVAWVIWRLY